MTGALSSKQASSVVILASVVVYLVQAVVRPLFLFVESSCGSPVGSSKVISCLGIPPSVLEVVHHDLVEL